MPLQHRSSPANKTPRHWQMNLVTKMQWNKDNKRTHIECLRGWIRNNCSEPSFLRLWETRKGESRESQQIYSRSRKSYKQARVYQHTETTPFWFDESSLLHMRRVCHVPTVAARRADQMNEWEREGKRDLKRRRPAWSFKGLRLVSLLNFGAITAIG